VGDRGGYEGRRWILALCLVVGACSDDGLTASQAASKDEAGSTGGEGATSSVNTSATVTATGGGGGDEPGVGDSSGADETGPESDPGTTSGVGTGFGSDEGDPPSEGTSSGGASPDGSTSGDEPDCVAADACACDPLGVVCEALPPACPPGEVAEVDAVGQCWTFACVPADSCTTVPDCTACTMDQACVVRAGPMGPSFVCEPVEPGCMGVPTCACMPGACPMPFECIGAPPKGGADLACTCEAC